MKIIHVIYNFGDGGAPALLADIANVQSKTENISIIAINKIENKYLFKDVDPSIKIHQIGRVKYKKHNPKYIFNKIATYIKINRIIKKTSPDIIHIHDIHIAKMISSKCKKVLSLHALDPSIKKLNKYDKVIAVSNSLKAIYEKNGIENISVVENGIVIDKIKTKEMYNNNISKIVQIGRLEYIKGQDVLVKALAQIINEHKLNIELHFIGIGRSENDKKQLIDLANKFNISNNIKFLNLKTREFIYNNLKDYDLLIQPSRKEAFGLTIAESMAAKVPVLASITSGPMEILDNGKYGSIFQSENINDLVNKILYINFNYKSIISNISEKRERITNNYTINIAANKYINEYNSILKDI